MTAPAPVRPEAPRSFRWLVLVVISLAMFGNYYVYDAISPIADLLTTQLGFSDSNIGLLQAIYSIPNIFMVLLGGFVIDRIGTRRGTLLFGVLCFLGAAITASSSTLTVMAIGRLVFGLGAESLIVAVTTALAKWFRGKELSFAFGLNLTIARLGSFAALNSPTWARDLYDSWRGPLLLSVGMATFCIVAPIVYWVLERNAEARYSLGEEGATDKIEWRDLLPWPLLAVAAAACAMGYVFHLPLFYYLAVALGIGVYPTLRFGVSYVFIVALCITFYSGIFPFQTFAVKFFMEAHGTSREFGGFLSSMLTLFAMVATPLFGLLVDKVGKRSLFMMLGSALLIPVYLIMAYTSVPLVVPMAMMGVAFSLIPAVMWPSVAYIVEQNKLGTAYGLMTMIQNIGLAGFNLLIGWANDFAGASAANPDGYRLGMWIFSSLGFVGLGFAAALRARETGPRAHGLETITAKG